MKWMEPFLENGEFSPAIQKKTAAQSIASYVLGAYDPSMKGTQIGRNTCHEKELTLTLHCSAQWRDNQGRRYLHEPAASLKGYGGC